MKKIILSVATVFATAFMSAVMTVTTVSGQTVKPITNQEVWRVIMESKQANENLHGIHNINQIKPGQLLTWHISDGTDTTVTVEKGDYEEKMVRELLVWLRSNHRDIVPWNDTTVRKSDTIASSHNAVVPLVKSGSDNSWIWICLILLFLAALLIWWFAYGRSMYRAAESKRKEAASRQRQAEIAEDARRRNPATAGPAMYPGGITEANAHTIMSENAHRRFPLNNIRIARIERGTLNSHGVLKEVGYGDYPRQMVLNNTPGIQATVYVGDEVEPRFVKSILDCGNDIRVGAGITDDGVTFTPTPEAQPLYAQPAPTTTSATNQQNASNDADADAGSVLVAANAIPAALQLAIQHKTGIRVEAEVLPDGKAKVVFQVYGDKDKKGQLPE